MKVIGKELLKNFIERHKDAKSALQAWRAVIEQATLNNVIDVRQIYPHADYVGGLMVFNIKGNHYRLIVEIHYDAQTVVIRDFLTHAEYSKDKWKK